MNVNSAVDLYELTMAQVYFREKRKAYATFDLFIRSRKRPFYIACGIDDALSALENFRFTLKDINYLKSLSIFEADFLEYLEGFRFKGDVWAVEEPEVIFSSEPIMRVTANIIEAQIVESILLNKINLATTLATKAMRIVMAGRGRSVYDFSLRRTQGVEAALACAKYSYIAGVKGTSNVYAGFIYKIPVVGTMAHSFVMSFEKEIDSFLAFVRQFPAKSILLVDTYNTKDGISKAIKIAKVLKRLGFNLLGIRLDSGDLVRDSKYARLKLDEEGLIDTIIFASGNLDEYVINDLIDKKAPIDAFGVGTNMGCSSDLPYTDVIYKLVEIREDSKSFTPTMKLSAGKTTLPSKKQIFRVFSQGLMKEDHICLDGERFNGRKLLRKVMHKGKRLSKEKPLKEKQRILNNKIKLLPSGLKKINTSYVYPVLISEELKKLVKRIRKSIRIRTAKKVMLLDIDTQFDFFSKKGLLYVKDSERIIPNIKRLINFARKNKILIVSSQDTHTRRDPEFKNFPPHCIKGSWGHKKLGVTLLKKHKIIPSSRVYSDEEVKKIIAHYPQVIIIKNVINVFSNPNTAAIFDLFFPEEIYVFGVATDYCVKEAVEELLKRNFSVVIVEDAVKEISLQDKNKLFSLWKKRGVRFIKTNRLIKGFN